MFFLLVASKSAADHFADQRGVDDLRMALYTSMSLHLDPKRTVPWGSPLGFQCPKRHVRTYADMKEELESVCKQIGNFRVMYTPGGLCYIDDNMTEAHIAHRKQAVESLGFTTVKPPAVKSADAAAAGSGNRGV